MTTVVFNAFSFLQKKLKAQDRPYANVEVDVIDGGTAKDLVTAIGLEEADIEAVFVNGSVSSLDTVLGQGDRVAVVPPGTPGPYRVLLGMVGRKKDS